jgi:DUF438 domain-containing protein
MAVHTRGFREAHAGLSNELERLRTLAERYPELTEEQRRSEHEQIVAFLHDKVEPHTKLDERLLYPEVAERLGDALVATSMNYDHLAIRHWIAELATADPHDTAHLQQLLYGLEAIIRVHIWKEEELFVKPLESGSWPSV